MNHYIQILIILPATCLKEEGLEVVGHMGDDNEEDGWDVHCKDGPEESSKKQTNKSEKEWLGCTPSRLSQGCV